MLLEGALNFYVVFNADIMRRGKQVLHFFRYFINASYGFMVFFHFIQKGFLVKAEEIILFGYFFEERVYFKKGVFSLRGFSVFKGVKGFGIITGISYGEKRLYARTLKSGGYGYGACGRYGGAGGVSRFYRVSRIVFAIGIIYGIFPIRENASFFG